MEHRPFGPLGMVSALTLGGGGTGQVWGPTTREEAVATTREAVEAFTRVLDIDPRDAAAWHNKGLALARLGQDEEARYCFAQSRALIGVQASPGVQR